MELGVKWRKSKKLGLKIAEQLGTSKFSSKARKLFLRRLLVNDLQSSHRLKNKWTSCDCYKCGLCVCQHWTNKVGGEKSRPQGLESEEWQRNPETLLGVQKSQRMWRIPTLLQNTRETSGLPWIICALKLWTPMLGIYLPGRWKQSWRTTLDELKDHSG